MTYATALDPDHPHKFNHARLHSSIGMVPPVEYEHTYYQSQIKQDAPA